MLKDANPVPDDDDMDGVPNIWEQVVPGMRWQEPTIDEENPKDTDSFGSHFKISGGSGASRDEEFYCVLGGALSVFGEVTDNAMTGLYRGKIPVAANTSNDWSRDGENWE